MKHTYKTSGTCSTQIDFEIENGIVTSVRFTGGCNGNTQGVAALCVGMKADEVVKRLKGIPCGFKNTSCPDQLAKAIEEVL